MGSAKAKYPRRDERFTTLGMSCPLGEIVDLSASGMRIRSPGKPDIGKGQANQFVLRTSKQKLTISGVVAWIHRQSLFSKQYEIGIRFTDSRGGTRDALVAFAKYGFVGYGQQKQSSSESDKRVVAKASVVVENYYNVLGVERGASEDAIRKAFWVLAKKYHPDSCGDPKSEVMFRKINEANEVLTDPERRRQFDQMLLAQMNAA
jgi:DnaJ domain/PilZ domain